MRHLIRYRMDRLKEPTTVFNYFTRAWETVPYLMVPVTACQTKYRIMDDLVLEADWKKIDCEPCRRMAKKHLKFRRWLKTKKGKEWAAKVEADWPDE